jgi:hypothetical protein
MGEETLASKDNVKDRLNNYNANEILQRIRQSLIQRGAINSKESVHWPANTRLGRVREVAECSSWSVPCTQTDPALGNALDDLKMAEVIWIQFREYAGDVKRSIGGKDKKKDLMYLPIDYRVT